MVAKTVTVADWHPMQSSMAGLGVTHGSIGIELAHALVGHSSQISPAYPQMFAGPGIASSRPAGMRNDAAGQSAAAAAPKLLTAAMGGSRHSTHTSMAVTAAAAASPSHGAQRVATAAVSSPAAPWPAGAVTPAAVKDALQAGACSGSPAVHAPAELAGAVWQGSVSGRSDGSAATCDEIPLTRSSEGLDASNSIIHTGSSMALCDVPHPSLGLTMHAPSLIDNAAGLMTRALMAVDVSDELGTGCNEHGLAVKERGQDARLLGRYAAAASSLAASSDTQLLPVSVSGGAGGVTSDIVRALGSAM